LRLLGFYCYFVDLAYSLLFFKQGLTEKVLVPVRIALRYADIFMSNGFSDRRKPLFLCLKNFI
ncbi:hypothetical protein AALA83_17570, partial [Oscillospiraceae bacterium 44-5]